MSEEQTQQQSPEVTAPTPAIAPAVQDQSRGERRQDRRDARAQAQARPSENAAPKNLFQKARGSDVQANPERVKIIKQHITEYAKVCTSANSDLAASRAAFYGLTSAIRNLFTLSGGEVKLVFDHLLSTIKQCNGDSFSMGILYRFVREIKNTQEHDTFVSVMDLITAYARLQDPSKIRQLKDVDYAVRHVKSTVAAKAFVSLFPGK